MSDDLPMRDVVELVLQAEGESKRILEEAQAEAERIVTAARTQAQELVQTARREATAEARSLVEQAERDAHREKEKQLAHAAAEIDTGVESDERAVESTIQAILRCVCGGQ